MTLKGRLDNQALCTGIVTQNIVPKLKNASHDSDIVRYITRNKKHISNKTKRHTNKDPGKTIYFPCSKKQSPDQTKSRAHQIMLR